MILVFFKLNYEPVVQGIIGISRLDEAGTMYYKTTKPFNPERRAKSESLPLKNMDISYKFHINE